MPVYLPREINTLRFMHGAPGVCAEPTDPNASWRSHVFISMLMATSIDRPYLAQRHFFVSRLPTYPNPIEMRPSPVMGQEGIMRSLLAVLGLSTVLALQGCSSLRAGPELPEVDLKGLDTATDWLTVRKAYSGADASVRRAFGSATTTSAMRLRQSMFGF
jgi:hypothetical protein